MINITFIGYGNMAKAIAKGLLKKKTYQISAASPDLKPGKDADGITTFADNSEAVTTADIIILAVKPKQMAQVYQEIFPHLSRRALVISVAAGIELSWFSKQQPNSKQAIIRVMPNLAAQNGQSATPLLSNAFATTAHCQHAEEIFNGIGITTWADSDDQVNAFTALSGSGPAYVFLFMEKMVEGAKKLGLSEKIATEFVQQTFKGALSVANSSDSDLKSLRKNVTSPQGTTAAAIETFEKLNLGDTIDKAMQAAYERAQEIAEQS